jgi:hypothetical protein
MTTSPYATRLTQAEYDANILGGFYSPPGRNTGPIIALSTTNIGAKEVEAFAKIVELEAGNAIPRNPEPVSEAEYNARGWQLMADAAKLGYDVKLMHPNGATATGPLGLFYPTSTAPFTCNTLAGLENIVAIALAKLVAIEAVRVRMEEHTADVNRAFANAARQQEYADRAPDDIAELKREIAALKAKASGA